MSRPATVALLLSVGLLAWLPAARGQDPNAKVTVYLESNPEKPLSGPVAEESVKGIRLKGDTKTISPADLLDVDYVEQLGLGDRPLFRQGAAAEKKAAEAIDEAAKKQAYQAAAAKYEEILEKLPQNLHAARRHVKFKIAYLKGLQGVLGDDADRFAASEALKAFKDEYKADAWQYTPAMLLLARLAAESKDVAEAQKYVKELSATPGVPDDVKQEAQLSLIDYTMAAGNYQEAQAELARLIPTLPKDSPQLVQARLTEAEALAGMNKFDEASNKLQDLLKQAQGKDVRAAAYTTLGECYYKADKLHEARWQFLWVDVVYNQDPRQHAKALYYLWQIFFRLREPERAEEFYRTLIEGERFQGSEFRRRAEEEHKKLEG